MSNNIEMPYEKDFRNPYQGLREFGRAALTKVGLPVDPVTSMSGPEPKSFELHTSNLRAMKRGMDTGTLAPVVHETVTKYKPYHNLLGRRVGKYGTRRVTVTANDTDRQPDKRLY